MQVSIIELNHCLDCHRAVKMASKWHDANMFIWTAFFLWDRDIVLLQDTFSWYAKHFMPNYFKILLYIRDLQPRHKWLHINIHSIFISIFASVTLTFETGMWFFHVTHFPDILNTSAKFYGNPFMQYRVMACTHKNLDEQLLQF